MADSISWQCASCGLANVNKAICQACFSSVYPAVREQLIARCKSKLASSSQSHVLDHIADLASPLDLDRLLRQIESIDFGEMSALYTRAMAEEKALKSADDEKRNIAPFPHKDAFDIARIGDVSQLVQIGFDAIANGRCGVVVLAGGQGTRLGFDRPKGCYPIGAISGHSIYQILIEKALAVKRLAAAAVSDSQIGKIRFPIFFMTSEATHEATQKFLRLNAYFGYEASEIVLFQQQLFPCLREADGACIMKSAAEIAASPNGNGGIYSSLMASGVHASMVAAGVQYVQVFGIDNVLARIGDPLWFGHMIASHADASNKTCIKKDAHEKVGVMVLRDGKPAVTEYTELTQDMVELRQSGGSGDLEYCYGNLAMHCFEIGFISKICTDHDQSNQFALPIHVARKKIPFYDSQTKETVVPDQNNGIKLEFFVFDTFQFSKKCTVYNILREEEFAPVKNAQGNDSPLTARVAVSQYWKKQIMQNGGVFSNDEKGDIDELFCEVSPLFGYLPYGDKVFATRVKGKTFKLPVYLRCD